MEKYCINFILIQQPNDERKRIKGCEFMSREITIFHIILLYIMSAGILNHVIIVSPLYTVAGRDAWISIIVSFFIYLIWALIVYKIVKVTRKENLYLWLKNNFGNKIANFMYFLIFVYLFTMCIITVKDMIIWTNSTFLPETPIFILVASFVILTTFMANTNIQMIAIVNGILLPIVLILGFFIAFINMPKKDFSLLFPLFEHGLSPIFFGCIYVGIGMIEVMIMIFLQHHLKSTVKYKHFVIMGLFCTWLTLGPVMSGIATFGPFKSSLLLFPAYEQWALGSIGRFIEHFDFFSIYQWLSGALIRVSLFLFMIVDMINISSKKQKKFTLISLGVIIVLINLISINYDRHFLLLGKYLIPSLLILMIVISLMLALLTLLHKRRNQHDGQLEITETGTK